jgi:GntR family transcriptional regulator
VAARSLRDLVARLEPGARLPGERELSARFGIARMTLRGAVDTLVSEGLVERRHGPGTYVRPGPMMRTLGLTSFSEDMRQRGLVPHSRLLSLEQSGATSAVADLLRVDEGTPVLRFERLRCGSGVSFAVETVWMPSRYVSGLAAEDLEGSFYALLGGGATVSSRLRRRSPWNRCCPCRSRPNCWRSAPPSPA